MRDITANVVQVRSASGADAEAIIRTHFAAVHETASKFYPSEVLNSWSHEPDEARYEQIRRAIAKGDELYVVAEDSSGVAGFGSIVPSLQELRAVYVHPRVARRGVGASILQELERLAVANHCVHLQMDASVNAEAFYSGHGYEVISRDVHRLASGHEMACTKMKKLLPHRKRLNGN
ncbi:MAG TPA: GNAT family N-acetyltransferase [Pyrinomonadaceae bacterium]